MNEMEPYFDGEPIEGKVIYVGGNRSGKTTKWAQAHLAIVDETFNPLAPTVADLEAGDIIEGVTDVGFSFGPLKLKDEFAYYRGINYAAQMRFEMDYAITQEQMKAMYHSLSYRRGILGEFALGYTPAEELRDRLNDRLQGKEPLSTINTRYWRDWK